MDMSIADLENKITEIKLDEQCCGVQRNKKRWTLEENIFRKAGRLCASVCSGVCSVRTMSDPKNANRSDSQFCGGVCPVLSITIALAEAQGV